MIILDRLSYAGNLASIDDLIKAEAVDLVVGDIADLDLVAGLLRDRDIDRIVHFAAESHVDRSLHGPEAFIETNILGTHQLLRAARMVWLDEGSGRDHRFHHISTDEVFGSLQMEAPPFTEQSPYAPNSPYSASKAAADHLVRAYHHSFGLKTSLSNCSNNYGPYQFPEKLIPLFLINALHGRPLPIYGDGANRRDWLHVDDHCAAIDTILHHGGAGSVYAVGGGCELSNLDLIDQLCAGLDAAFAARPALAEHYPDAPAARGLPTASLKQFVPDRPGHDRRYAIDASLIAQDLGFRPQVDFKSGLAQTITWYLDHPHWWQAILDGRYRDWIDQHYKTLIKTR
jgi:dTDP-glucose 4,6-dehydratase